MKRLVLLPLLAVAALAAVPAHAIVPPRDCGRMTVKGKLYGVKADQMRCADAKRYTKNYLTSTKRKPAGFRCNRYDPKDTKLAFRCTRGVKNFFAIRR